MSFQDRIRAINNKVQTIEQKLHGNPANPKVASGQTPKGISPEAAANFQSIMGNMQAGERFDPSKVQMPTPVASSSSPSQFDSYIQEAAQKHNVDPNLVRAVIQQESAFDPNATSHCGAQGLMQLMPETAKEVGVTNPYDPKDNIMGGTKYLGRLLTMFDGDLTKTIAAYNAGPGAVDHYNGVPPYSETQGYVKKVKGYYQSFSG